MSKEKDIEKSFPLYPEAKKDSLSFPVNASLMPDSRDSKGATALSLSSRSPALSFSYDPTPLQDLRSAPLADRKALIAKWIPAVFMCGATPYFAGRHVDILSRALDVKVTVTYLPGRVFLLWSDSDMPVLVPVSWAFRVASLQVLDKATADLQTFLRREKRALKDANPTEKTSLLIEDNQYSSCPVPRTLADLHQLADTARSKPLLYSPLIVVLSFAMLSGTMAPAFFGGGWIDGFVALALGALAGMMVVACDWSPGSFLYLHEMVSSTLTSLFTALLVYAFPKLSYWPIVLAATIWILPGFSMVIGIMDLLLKSPVTGIVVHIGGFLVALVMALGYSVSIWFLNKVGCDLKGGLALLISAPETMHIAIRIALCVPFSAACAVIFQASPRQMPLIGFSLVFCFVLCEYVNWPEEVKVLVVAFASGIFSRSLAAILDQLPEAAIYVAMLPLVPGSRTVRSSFAESVVIHGSEQLLATADSKRYFVPLFSNFLVCVAVAIGLIAADLAFNRALRPWVIRPLTRLIKKSIRKRKQLDQEKQVDQIA